MEDSRGSWTSLAIFIRHQVKDGIESVSVVNEQCNSQVIATVSGTTSCTCTEATVLYPPAPPTGMIW